MIDTETELRKYTMELRTIGAGVIARGLWNAVRLMLAIVFFLNDVSQEPDFQSLREFTLLQSVIFYGIMSTVVLISFGYTAFIGLSARREARDRKRGSLYLVAEGFNILFYVLDILACSMAIIRFPANALDNTVSIIVDVTMIAMGTEMIYYTIRLRKIRKKIAESEREQVAEA